MHCENPIRKYVVTLGLLLSVTDPAVAERLADFHSDGCSLFPDGTPIQQNLWCECCVAHDIAYWQGGTRKQKQQADQTLRLCVADKTGNEILAETMYYGVALGGSPVFPTWYRWCYGWHYGRGFRKLNRYEKQQVTENLQHYRLLTPQSSCSIEHPLEPIIKRAIRQWLPLNNVTK